MIRLVAVAALLPLLLISCSSASEPAGGASEARSTPVAAAAASASPSSGGSTSTAAAATPRPGGPAPTGVPSGMGSPAADGVFPRTVGHFGGSARIPTEPKRIVTIATGQLDSALTLGVVPVAAAAGAGAELVPAYPAAAFPQYASQLKGMSSVGNRTGPELEKIAVAHPNLILANKAAAEKIYDRLSAIAPTVLTEGTGVNWKQDFLLIAAALGKSEAAQRFLNGYYQQAAEIAQRVGATPPTVSMVRFNPGRTRVFGVASFGGSIAYDAGLARPLSQQFDDTSQDLSLEQINSMDGDWIFYSIQGAADKTDAAKVVGGAIWTRLNAVRAGHAAVVDDDPWYLNAGPTAAMLVLRTLRETIAP